MAPFSKASVLTASTRHSSGLTTMGDRKSNDETLPLNGGGKNLSRTKAALGMMTCSVGAGQLVLPNAMAEAGLLLGTIFMILTGLGAATVCVAMNQANSLAEEMRPDIRLEALSDLGR